MVGFDLERVRSASTENGDIPCVRAALEPALTKRATLYANDNAHSDTAIEIAA